MKTYHISLILAAFAVTSLHAQDDKPSGGHRPPPSPLLGVLDADKDGELSAEEIQSAANALAKLDQDGNGTITRDELKPQRPESETGEREEKNSQGKPPHFKAPPVIAALDTDKNGTISAEELDEAPESLKELDKNNDGELSPNELHPHGPPPPREQGQGGRPHGPPPVEEEAEIE